MRFKISSFLHFWIRDIEIIATPRERMFIWDVLANHGLLLYSKIPGPFLYSFFLQSVNRKYWSNIICWWLDSISRPLVSEETTQPTEPQPLPGLFLLFWIFVTFPAVDLTNWWLYDHTARWFVQFWLFTTVYICLKAQQIY